MEKITRAATLTNIKAGEDNGLEARTFTGYASVFGNIDSYGDVVTPGAFAESLAEWNASEKEIPLLYGHNITDIDGYIGAITSAQEDANGLLVTGTFDDSEIADKVYRQVKGRRINELSFAFTIAESEYGDQDGQRVRFLKSVNLLEVSIVPIGANPNAQIQDVKAAGRPTAAARWSVSTLDRLIDEPTRGVYGVKEATDRRAALAKMKDHIGNADEQNTATAVKAFIEHEQKAVQTWLDERTVPKLVFTAGDTDAETRGDAKFTPPDVDAPADAPTIDAMPVDELAHLRTSIMDNIKAGTDATLTAAARLQYVEKTIAVKRHAAATFNTFETLFNALPTASSEHDRNQKGRNHMNTKAISLKASNLATEINRAADQFVESKAATLGLTSTDLAVSFDPTILAESKEPLAFLAALQTVPVETRNFTFYRQTKRNNKAAVVKPGDTKPTTNVGLEAVTGELDVVAHITRVDKYIARDALGVSALLETELTYGVLDAVEKLAAATIANDKGVNSQAFDTDIHTTIRRGITILETTGQTPTMVVLTPADLEALELAKASGSGEFLNPTAPSDRGTRTVWNLPVLVSNNLKAGTGLILTNDAARIYTDGRVEIETTSAGQDFDTNQIALRCEGRFKPAVTRPAGIVKLATAAAA